MADILNRIDQLRLAKTTENLKKNNFQVVFVEKKEEVLSAFARLVPKGSTVCSGNSLSIQECGLAENLRKSKSYTYMDKTVPGISEQDKELINHKAFGADAYLCSADAITEHGELYQVDALGNRIAAMMYGPKKVIVVAGMNKIVPDLAFAVRRVKQIACPAHAALHGWETFCFSSGTCISPGCEPDNLMAVPAGSCQTSLCSFSTVFAQQPVKDRICVILVGEKLGH